MRLAVASKNKGKSGGMRILYLARIIKQKIYLFSIFDKSQQENISQKNIAEIFKNEGLL
ncbi:MAG: type II toxin-antitoxin system RelE/ParE family toxin [Chitinophagales bacterium]|nr:type II toxin-antitoxin system RelE/ParE family toxin [Chitinophagales bacterium]